jgi:4-carboxymuconolactone decarboxylase
MGAPAYAQQQETPSRGTQQSRAQQLMGDIAPKLAELTDNVLFGDIWERPGLSKRDRSLVTVTEVELIEAITHLAFYSGWPNVVSAAAVAREVFKQR